MIFKNPFKKSRPIIKGINPNLPFGYKLEQGLDCDEIPNCYGEFGRTPTNPIPVNGSTGELIYLNSIKDSNNQSLIYHRLTITPVQGLEEFVDIFEVVSIDGKFWDILYFHMYHPRNSNKLPKGYRWAKYHKIWSHSPIGLGYDQFHPDFPHTMQESLSKYQGLLNVVKIYDKYTMGKSYIRPAAHFERLIHINNRDNILGYLVAAIAIRYPRNFFINLLHSSDIDAQSVAIVCLERTKETISEQELISICKFAFTNREWEINETIIQIVNSFDDGLTEEMIFNPFLQILNDGGFKKLQSEIKRRSYDLVKVYSFKLIPFLYKITKHKKASDELIEQCNFLMEEIILNLD
jgi:hypothetical protein